MRASALRASLPKGAWATKWSTWGSRPAGHRPAGPEGINWLWDCMKLHEMVDAIHIKQHVFCPWLVSPLASRSHAPVRSWCGAQDAYGSSPVIARHDDGRVDHRPGPGATAASCARRPPRPPYMCRFMTQSSAYGCPCFRMLSLRPPASPCTPREGIYGPPLPAHAPAAPAPLPSTPSHNALASHHHHHHHHHSPWCAPSAPARRSRACSRHAHCPTALRYWATERGPSRTG